MKILKSEPDRIIRSGVCVWVVHRVTTEDGAEVEWWASGNEETQPMWKPVTL